MIQPLELSFVFMPAKDPVQVIDEIIARGPLHRPNARQVFVEIQNLFDYHVYVAGFSPQAVEVFSRVVQAIDVVHSKAFECAVLSQLEDKLVCPRKY